MWGYIVSVIMFRAVCSVPSLYVRVYRIEEMLWTIAGRSLIICEGISHITGKIILQRLFPHYMWGYIELIDKRARDIWVPSLYVRVYRRTTVLPGGNRSSLIICEGISPVFWLFETFLEFPHYMWGYIGNGGLLLHSWHVPSLYVRVYRTWTCRACWLSCSLIICEGISYIPPPGGSSFGFPHYMWGYIINTANCWRV